MSKVSKVTLKLEVEVDTINWDFFAVMESLKEIVDKALDYGSVKGTLQIDKQNEIDLFDM